MAIQWHILQTELVYYGKVVLSGRFSYYFCHIKTILETNY